MILYILFDRNFRNFGKIASYRFRRFQSLTSFSAVGAGYVYDFLGSLGPQIYNRERKLSIGRRVH